MAVYRRQDNGGGKTEKGQERLLEGWGTHLEGWGRFGLLERREGGYVRLGETN